MKTLRYTKKIYPQKLIFFLAGISASLQSKLIPVTKIKTSCCQNKTASMDGEVLCQADHLHAGFIPQYLNLYSSPVSMARASPDCDTQSSAVQAQNWEPASPSRMSTALKTDSKY